MATPTGGAGLFLETMASEEVSGELYLVHSLIGYVFSSSGLSDLISYPLYFITGFFSAYPRSLDIIRYQIFCFTGYFA